MSNDGDLVYELPGSFRQALQSKSVRLRLEPLIERVSGGAMYVTRVSFGTALIASLVIVYMAIIAITTSRDSNDDRRGGGYYGGGGGMFMPYYSPFNSFFSYVPASLPAPNAHARLPATACAALVGACVACGDAC